MSERTSLGARELHDLGDTAAFRGDFETAKAYRLLEGNVRGGEVMRDWIYKHLAASEAEIHHMAVHLALGWGASEHEMYRRAMNVIRSGAPREQAG